MIYRPAALKTSTASTSRRALCRLAVSAVVFAGAVGCNKKPEPTPEAAPSAGAPVAAAAPADGNLTVGFIYVGPKDDYGYNQAHAEAAKIVATLPNIKIREEENVPETVAVQKTMESMINLDGAKLLFPTSFGYFDPHILKLAEKYPDITFFHCGGLYTEGKHPKNVGSYFGYIDEAEYLSGIVAGLTTKTNKLGFIAAKPIPQVLRNINAYTLGAKSVNPKATMSVIFTGDWSLPIKEAEAANSLIDQGADVLTSHVDSPKVVIETAERRNAFTTGYHASQAKLAPNAYLTGAEWNWLTAYTTFIEAAKSGKPHPNFIRGGLKDGFVKMSPYGPTVTDAAKKNADAIKAKMVAGSFDIFAGALKDNKGNVVVPAGKTLKQTDIELEKMNYLVEGVIGKIPS